MAGESDEVVFHGGRRYKRKDTTADSVGRQNRIKRGRLSKTGCVVPQQPIKPHPPLYDSRSRGIPSQTLTSEPSPTPSPFQRYKPLPAIGSIHDVSSCPLENHPHHSSFLSASSKSVTLCVRLPDGSSRSEVTLPLSSPLSSVVTAALRDTMTEAWLEEGQNWVLCTSEVPKRELHNLSLSLQEAGLTTPSILHLFPS